jgi:hypothetical protein
LVLGGHLLTIAIQTALGFGAKRLWVQSWFLNHSSALAYSHARVFIFYKTEAVITYIPDQSLGVWVGLGERV